MHPGPDGLNEESGVFMKALQTELHRRGHAPAFQAMRDHDPQLLREDLEKLQEILAPALK